jgi:PIN domain nuclease of toxin-antitoxin system
LFSDQDRIGKRARAELGKSDTELWVSPISTWEILTLNAKGRVRISGGPEQWLARVTGSVKEAPLTHEIVLAAAQIQMHRDPADRFLAATAQVLGLTLVTADEKLLGLGSIQSLANR